MGSNSVGSLLLDSHQPSLSSLREDISLSGPYGGGVFSARAPILLLLAAAACASAPVSTSRPAATEARAPDGTPILLANAPVDPTARIGQATLERARTLLVEARNELEPGQWKLLESRLTEAERAFERFNRFARANGRVAEVARSAEVPEAGRTGEVSAIGKAARAGPLLALLILLWPSETAGPADDHGPGPVNPEEEFKGKLRQLSLAAQQVQSELVSARQDSAVEAARQDGPSKPNTVEIHDKNAPKDAPCTFEGGGSKEGIEGWVRCTYVCGRYVVNLYDVWGTSTKACEEPLQLQRARRLANTLGK